MWTALALIFQIASIMFITVVTVKNKKYRQGKTNEVVAFIMLSVASLSLAMFLDNMWSLLFFGLQFVLLITSLVLAVKARTYATATG
ncbi:hypothetical protein [Salimicrobium halophilum]|uniref:Uncharacterized protein n=1 Tax=Salimicrobium halophilum TaxID=86666 RepID=A0A1G8TBA9_9BACI|nr:hypothetical protein [Salimicrobium halophilum]SDJ37970.1 hypothetical protein SAMN04490247_1771 [Salimicrobium halophilum]